MEFESIVDGVLERLSEVELGVRVLIAGNGAGFLTDRYPSDIAIMIIMIPKNSGKTAPF